MFSIFIHYRTVFCTLYNYNITLFHTLYKLYNIFYTLLKIIKKLIFFIITVPLYAIFLFSIYKKLSLILFFNHFFIIFNQFSLIFIRRKIPKHYKFYNLICLIFKSMNIFINRKQIPLF